MQVTRVRVYPVKSFAGVDVGSATVLPWGLAGDRRWAVVDPGGDPVTAREANGLLALTAEVLADGGLLLGERDRDGAGEPLRVDVPTNAAPIFVGHSRQGTALPAGWEADEWLTTRLGRPVRLVWQPDPRARPVNPEHGGHAGRSGVARRCRPAAAHERGIPRPARRVDRRGDARRSTCCGSGRTS